MNKKLIVKIIKEEQIKLARTLTINEISEIMDNNRYKLIA